MGRIKEEIFNCNVIIVIVAVIAITGIFFSMVGANESWESLFRETFTVLVSAIVTIWIAGKVAREAAIKGAEAGGKAAKEAAIQGAEQAARLKFNWERYKEIRELNISFLRTVSNARSALMYCQQPNIFGQSLMECESVPKLAFEIGGFVELNDEEAQFILGIENLTKKQKPGYTMEMHKATFDETPRIKAAILNEGYGKEIRENLIKKLNACERKYTRKIANVLEL